MTNSGPAGPLGSAEAYLHYLEGNLLADRGDHSAAIDAYRQVLALDEGATHARLRLASEYWRLGLSERAEAERWPRCGSGWRARPRRTRCSGSSTSSKSAPSSPPGSSSAR